MRLFYSGVHIDNDQDDDKYQLLAKKFHVIQTEMYHQQEELNEIITDMDQIVDAAHKVDEKKKRKDRQETQSSQGLKDRKVKTRTKQATSKKIKQDSLSVESKATRESKPERNKLYKDEQAEVDNILISSPPQQQDADTAREDVPKALSPDEEAEPF